MHDAEIGVGVLAERLSRRLPAVVEDVMHRQLREVPELFVSDDPAYRQAVLRSTRENIELILAVLRRPETIPSELPVGPRLEADAAAQYGANVEPLLRTYRVGQQALIEHLLAVLPDAGPGQVADPPATMRAATRILHRYTEAVMPLVAREHSEEQMRLLTRPAVVRLRAVEALLAGEEPVDVDYDCSGPQVALVTGTEGAEAAVAAAAEALGCAATSVRAGDGTCLAWLGTADAQAVCEELRGARLRGPAGVGGGGAGPAGFRMAHRQARLAERIARGRERAAGRGGAVVDVRTVALEAIALADQDTALGVARGELGPLAEPGARSALLRSTLMAWFAAHERREQAAAALGVSPRTVSYRLRRVEALLGCPISGRRAELEAAVRVVALFERAAPLSP